MEKFTIELAAEDLKLIGSLLVKMPYERVEALIDHINGQVAAQIDTAKPPEGGEPV